MGYIEKPSMTIKPDRPVMKKVKQKPLLTIEIENETAVPKVFYEGKEITDMVRISFSWDTKTAELGSGGTRFNVEHVDVVNDEPVQKGVDLARGKYLYGE